MCWSVSFMGKPEKVAEAVEAHGATLSGQSKEEYDAAAPALAAMVRQNFSTADGVIVKLDASGSGWKSGDQESRQLQVNLQPSWTKLLV